MEFLDILIIIIVVGFLGCVIFKHFWRIHTHKKYVEKKEAERKAKEEADMI